MSRTDVQELMGRVARGEIDPIAAATDLFRGGDFGLVGMADDAAAAQTVEGLRLQAMMGRLLWLGVFEADAQGLPQPTTLEEYRDFFLQAMAADEKQEPEV